MKESWQYEKNDQHLGGEPVEVSEYVVYTKSISQSMIIVLQIFTSYLFFEMIFLKTINDQDQESKTLVAIKK